MFAKRNHRYALVINGNGNHYFSNVEHFLPLRLQFSQLLNVCAVSFSIYLQFYYHGGVFPF